MDRLRLSSGLLEIGESSEGSTALTSGEVLAVKAVSFAVMASM